MSLENIAAYDSSVDINTRQNRNSCISDPTTPPQFFINVYNNKGDIIIGDNNNVNIIRSAIERCRSHANVSDEITTAIHTSIREPPSSYTGFRLASGKTLPNEESLAQEASSQQPRREYKREKRKEDSLVYEVSDFLKRKKNDHKRTKRGKRDSRLSTPSSDEETSTVSTFNKLAPESESDFSLERGLRVFNSFSKRLHPLRDDGRWTDFDRDAQQLLDQTGGDLTCQIIITLEKSLPLSYQNRLEESENLINEAVENISQTRGSGRLLLEMLSKCYLAALYRRRKMLGATDECLDSAKKISSGFPPCLAIAILLYEEGSYKRDLAAMLSGQQKKIAINEARDSMKSCADLCCGLDCDYVRKQHFALSKIASINLQCETSESRKEEITRTNLREAGQSLETLRSDHYCKTEAKAPKILRLKAEVDLYYRMKKLPEAEKIALEALELVDSLGFNLERRPLEDRLEDIQRAMSESKKPSSREKYRETSRPVESSSDSLSSQNNSPHSSEYDNEEKN